MNAHSASLNTLCVHLAAGLWEWEATTADTLTSPPFGKTLAGSILARPEQNPRPGLRGAHS